MRKANHYFRTELNGILTHKKEMIDFVRVKEFSLINLFTRTIFKSIHQPRAAPGFTVIALG